MRNEEVAAFRYWRAVAYARTDRVRAAIDSLLPLDLERRTDCLSGFSLAAARLLARLLADSGDVSGALSLYGSLARSAGTNSAFRAENAFEWARLLVSSGDSETGIRVLEAGQATSADGPLGDEARLLAGSLYSSRGDFERVRNLLRSLSGPGVRPEIRSEAILELAEMEGGGGRPRTSTPTRGYRERLEFVITNFPALPAARRARLMLGENFLASGDFVRAEQAFRAYLEVYPTASAELRAVAGLGRALSGLARSDEAFVLFSRARDLATNDVDRAHISFLTGNVFYRTNDWRTALGYYAAARRLVCDGGPGTSAPTRVGVRALFREADVLFRLGERAAARRDFADLSRVAGLSDFLSRDEFSEFQVWSGTAASEAGDLARATNLFHAVAASAPARGDEMAFRTVLALAAAGEDGAAHDLAVSVLGRVKEGGLRADVALWLARYAWREQAYSQVVEYVTVARAAAGTRSDMAAACLLQGEALMALARFEDAVLVLEEGKEKGESRKEKGESRKEEGESGKEEGEGVGYQLALHLADALFALGADNDGRYRAALAAYRELRAAAGVSDASRLLISFKIARTLEKLNRLEEATAEYYDGVVLAYGLARQRGARLTDSARNTFARAAFHLADQALARGERRVAVAMLKRVAISDAPAAGEAANRIERIKEGSR